MEATVVIVNNYQSGDMERTNDEFSNDKGCPIFFDVLTPESFAAFLERSIEPV